MRRPGAVQGMVLAGSLTVLLAACGNEAQGPQSAEATQTESTAAEGPAVVAVIGSITGPIPFPDAAQAAVATFEAEAGERLKTGLDVQLFDDEGDPATSTEVGQQIVDAGAVVVAGSSSTSDCRANKTAYADAGLVSLMGTGTQPDCFEPDSAITSANPSAFVTTELSLRYLSEAGDPGRICFFGNRHDDVPGNFTPAIESWSAATGDTLVVENQTVTPEDDMTVYAQTILDEDCDTVVMETLPASSGEIILAADDLGVTDVTYMMASASDTVAAAVGEKPGRVVLAASQFAPFDSDSPGVQGYLAMSEEAGLSPSAFGLGGYLAAQVTLDVMEQLEADGQPLTRESVSTALAEGAHDTYGITGADLVLGQENRSMQVVQLTGKRFVETDAGWVS